MESLISKYNLNKVASKKKQIFARLFDYFSVFVVSYFVYAIGYTIFVNSSLSNQYATQLNEQTHDLYNYVSEKTHLQTYNEETKSLDPIENTAKIYVLNWLKTSCYVHDMKYKTISEGQIIETPIDRSETFIADQTNFSLDNVGYYFKKYKSEEPSLNNFVIGGVDYKDDKNTYLYDKIMNLDKQYFVAMDNPDYIARGEGAPIEYVLTATCTSKLITRIGLGETTDEYANNLYNYLLGRYITTVQFGVGDVERNSIPYNNILSGFNQTYNNISLSLVMVYIISFFVGYVLLTVIMRFIGKEWTTIGQKVLKLGMCTIQGDELKWWNLVVYHVINLLLFSTSMLIGFFFTGIFGVMSLEIAPHFTMLSLVLFFLPLAIISLFMPLFNKNRHSLSTLGSRTLIKDKNEYENPVGLEDIYNEKGVVDGK